MLLLAMSLGDKFYMSRKGGTGRCTQRVQTAWLCLDSALERPWLALDGPFISSYAWMGLENTSLILYGFRFLALKVFSQYVRIWFI